MQSAARRLLVVVLTVSLVAPWSAAADARAFVARPRGFWRLPRARCCRAAEACAVQQLLAQARANLDTDEPATAEKQFAAVLRLEPCNVSALIGRGNALRQLDRPDAALNCFQAALRFNPKNPEAFSGRGRVRSDKTDFDGALADCTEAIRLSPNSSEAYRNRGCVFGNHHEPDKAIADFERAIELSPHNAWAYYCRARARWDTKQQDQAISDVSEAIKLAPGIARFVRVRASLWGHKNETAKAIADLGLAIRLKPTEVEYYLARSDAYSSLNDSEGAIADASRAIELNAKNATARFFRGRSYCMKGDWDRAIGDLTDAIRLDPKYTGAYYYRCVAFAARQQVDTALADADEAIRLDPSVSDLYRARGLIYRTKGDEAHAKRDLYRCRVVALQAVLRDLDLAPKNKEEPTVDGALELRIRRQVESLGYGDSVQQSIVELVRTWNLPALKHKLDSAMSDWNRHKLSTAQFVKVQQNVAEDLARIINTVIWATDYKTGGHELTEVAQDKVGCCQGMGLLYYVLGNAVGLSVEGLDVDLMADGPSPDGVCHIACIVELSDSSLIMVDATKQVGHNAFVSKPFRLKDLFRLVGTYWELKNKANPLGLHQVVQIVNANGLIALLEVNRAMELIKKGDFSGAKHDCVKALAQNNRSWAVYFCDGHIYGASGRYGDAVGSFSDAVARDPSDAIAYAYRGWCYDKLGKNHLALADFNKALYLSPKLTLALTSRCRCYLTAGDLQRAMEDADAALKTNRDDAETYQLRAEIWDDMGNRESELLSSSGRRESPQQPATAGSNYPPKSLVAGDPTDDPEQKANTWKHIEDLTNPIPVSAPSASSESADPIDVIQHVSARKDYYEHAVSDLSEALRLDPESSGAIANRGRVYAQLGNLNAALADCSEAIRLDPKNVAFYRVRSAVYETKGEPDKAIADVDTIIRLDPKSADAYTARAELYASKHDVKKAAADYREAERLKPSDDRYR
jgi:tetratricopeptide (TPR) repeat protein